MSFPPSIQPLIDNAPLLKGESSQAYNDLFAALARDVVPRDIIEWLWVAEFMECCWEIWRIRGYRAKLVNSLMNYQPNDEAGPASALFRSAPKIEALDKMLVRAQLRADKVLVQLEGRREVFASRARHAAEIALREAIPMLPSPPTMPLLPTSTSDSPPDNGEMVKSAAEPAPPASTKATKKRAK